MSHKSQELSGGNVNYYLVEIKEPKRLKPYIAECEDIIEALGMTFYEGCEFKALWRSCAARTLGKRKVGDDEHGIYDADKCVHYATQTARLRKRLKRYSLVVEKPTEVDNTVLVHVLGSEATKEIPNLMPTATFCIHKFGSVDCGRPISEFPCDKTLKMCYERDNAERFCAVQLRELTK